jgi:RNA polymerase sigma-70 factor (ECF subfamily)
MDDEDLVARVRAGDFDAANALLSKHQDAVYTVAFRLLGDHSEAEDVAQETLVRGYTRIAELQEGTSFAAWLRRIAVNLSLNLLRRRGVLHFESLDAPVRRDETNPRDLPDERYPLPETEVLTRELRDRIEASLKQLPAEQRVAVVLRDMYGYDVAEVAELQRCGVSAAKMRVFRGRASLRRLLSPAAFFPKG